MSSPMQKVSPLVSAKLGDTLDNIRNWGGVFYNALNYGIFPDGTDVTNELQALVNLANSEGRSAIFFPHGDYYVTYINNDENITYFGDNAKFVGGYDRIINQVGYGPRNELFIDIRDYGAKGDGVTDDTASIQQAIDDASVIGGTVIVPNSNFGYRIAQNTLNLKRDVALVGAHDGPYIPNLYAASPSAWCRGSTFLITAGSGSTSGQTILMNDGTNIRGINFFYPNQTDTNPPLQYPPTIRLNPSASNGCAIRDCYFINPYIAIDATGGHQDLFVENVYGQPLYRGLRIDGASAVDIVKNLNFGPFWNRKDYDGTNTTRAGRWSQENGIGIEIYRADDIVISDSFLYGYFTGLALKSSANGNSYGRITNSGFDYNRFAIRSDNGINSNGWLIDNCHIIPTTDAAVGSVGVFSSGSGNDIRVSNCAFWGSATSIYSGIQLTAGNIGVSNCFFKNWTNSAISLSGDASIQLTGSRFNVAPANTYHIAIDPAATGNFVVSGNYFMGGRVVYNPGSKTITTGN